MILAATCGFGRTVDLRSRRRHVCQHFDHVRGCAGPTCQGGPRAESRQQHCKANRHRFICTKNLILVLDSYGKVPTVLTTSTQHANLKHCDSLAFFTTQHLRPSDHTRASFNTRDPMQGRAAAGAVRGLQPSIPGRSHAAQAVRARFAWTGTSAPRPVLLLRSGMPPCAGRRVLQPSIMGHPCGLTGRQASAAQAVGARAWTGPSGPRGTVRRPASGHMRPCERLQQRQRRSAGAPLQNGLTTAVRSRFASRQCTLLHEQDPRDRAVWSAACSSCHPGQWWASGLFCMAVVQLWCT